MSDPVRIERLESTFPLGQVTVTRNALHCLAHEDILAGLRRHASTDWGEVDQHDRAMNDQALQTDQRLLSVYRSGKNKRFFVITEHDRSTTTVLMPEDY